MRNCYPACLLVFLFSITIHRSLPAQSVTRGPYLQSQGPNSIIIRWRTDSLTDSRVYYGDTLGATTFFKDSTTLTTEHRVLLTGLTPLTKYYYSIGSSSQILRGNDSLLYFKTAPDSNSHVPVRFWAIGDFGHGNQAQADVRESYLRYAQKTKPADLQLWLGDNVYQDGTDAEYQSKVFDTVYGYGNLFPYLPFASTSGNHDYNSICPWQDANGLPVLCNINPNNHTGPYLSLIDPPTQGELGGVASGRKIFYSMDYGDIHFVFLNSELGSYNNAYNWTGVLNNSSSFTSPMLDWLKADLQATTKKWKVVIWHQCPYSAQDNFTEENSVQIFCVATRHHFNPIIEQYGADLVLTGHDHNFQRSYLINGHYGGKSSFTSSMMINGSSGKEDLGEPYVKYVNGPLAGKGTVYVVAGNSSGSNAYSPFNHPAIYYGQACDTCFGSFVFDVQGDRLDGYYLTSTDSVYDYFTILKQTWSSLGEDNVAARNIHIYPNPTSGNTEITYSVTTAGKVSIEVLNIHGQVVSYVSAVNSQPGNYREIIDFSNPCLSSGTYTVRINCGGELIYKRIVKAG
ncbi:MAG: metallophosphoesterase [Chitinophagales bacterium]|nr:metallophosphoesterase [Chitinophagales bacterium]